MAKIGRNDPCPCGSGKKYKRCCLANDEAAVRERRAAANTVATAPVPPQSHLCHDCTHELDDAANAVFALIDAGKFDAAEQAAHDVLTRFPDMHDGYECFGRLYQAKGDHSRAAECYRKVIAFARTEPHLYDPGFVGHFQNLIERLEPRAAAN